MFQGKQITLAPGQLTITPLQIANYWNMKTKYGKPNTPKVKRILKAFENEHQIEQRGDSQKTLISIVNWNKYQLDGQQNGHQTDNGRTSNGHQSDIKRTLKEERKKEKKEENVKNERIDNPSKAMLKVYQFREQMEQLKGGTDE